MKYLIILLLIVPSIAFSQSRREINSQRKYQEKMLMKERRNNPYIKIGSGGTMIAGGGVLLAGGAVLLSTAKTNDNKTAGYVVTGAGGVLCLIGGAVLSTAANRLAPTWGGLKKIKFTGSSFIVKL